jgi:hypothetical protein
MAEYEDTSAALRRLEAALERIAAHVARPRPSFAAQDELSREFPSGEVAEGPVHHEIVTKLDDLIGGLRTALGIERPS